MELLLHKFAGKPACPPVPVLVRRCTPGEAPAVFALQNFVRAAMPDPSQFVPDTLEHLSAYLAQDLCVGAWQGQQLAGYLIVRFCGQSRENYASFLGVPQEQWDNWANADSAIVHPDYRGNGLQRKLLEAALPLFPENITHIGATVSPQNCFSLNNALASGFVIAARREMYGGYDRYLLQKKL